MKIRLAIPFFLLLTGAALGAFLQSLTTEKHSTATEPATHPIPGSIKPSSVTTHSTRDPGAGLKDQGPGTAPAFDWSELESTDFKVYVANLRAIGCPEKTIHDIIRAELNQLYEPRYRELDREEEEEGHQDYWKLRPGPGPAAEYARHATHRRLDREKESLLDELLHSPDEENHHGEQGELAQTASNREPHKLPGKLRDQVNEIQEKYNHLQDEIYHNASGEIYPDDALALQELRAQRLEELSGVLTPEQLREFDLRESPTAEEMRHNLMAFQPAEDEFRAIFDLRQSFESEFGEHHFEIPNEGSSQKREAAEQVMNEQIKALLGEERFAEYELSTDHRYRDLYRLGQRFDLPETGVKQMYDLWQSSEQQVDQIHGNEFLTHEEKMLELAALREEGEIKGREYLGEAAFFNYRARDGEWMAHLFE